MQDAPRHWSPQQALVFLAVVLVSLLSPSGRSWTIGTVSDTFVRVGGRTLAFGHRAAGFEYQNTSVAARGGG